MPYTNIPKDPIMLLSFVNTQLRDSFTDLDEFCTYYNADKSAIIENLANINYSYHPDNNQFT